MVVYMGERKLWRHFVSCWTTRFIKPGLKRAKKLMQPEAPLSREELTV